MSSFLNWQPLNSVADSCFGFTERFLSFVTPEYARSSDLALAEGTRMRSLCLLPVMMGWLWAVNCLNCGRKSFLKPIIVPSQITVCGSRLQSGHSKALSGLRSRSLAKAFQAFLCGLGLYDSLSCGFAHMLLDMKSMDFYLPA